MTKVWLVSSGAYSDKRFDAVCSSREKAQKYMDRYGNKWSDWNDPLEVELDHGVEDTRISWRVVLAANGDLQSIEAAPDVEPGVRSYHTGYLAIGVRAETQALALKIAGDLRIQYLANAGPRQFDDISKR